MTEYTNRALIICTNKDAGNSLANMAASFLGDPGAELGTFTDARMVALSSEPLVPVAWYVEVMAKPAFSGVIEALAAGADYSDPRLDYLKASPRNLTTEQWAMAAAIFPHVAVTVGHVPGAMAALATANGYTIVEAQEP